MAFEIQFDEAALDDLMVLPKHLQTTVLDAIQTHLTHQPDLVSKSHIKRLRDYFRP
jgi:mRNA-degrading endonuclease RelE of RelBE toxin-antitoxin system